MLSFEVTCKSKTNYSVANADKHSVRFCPTHLAGFILPIKSALKLLREIYEFINIYLIFPLALFDL